MKTESVRPLDAVCALAPSEPQLLCAHRYTLSTELFFISLRSLSVAARPTYPLRQRWWGKAFRDRNITEAEFLEEIQTKVLRVFLLAIHSLLYSCALRLLFLQTHATSYSFYNSATVHCKGERRKTW
jgi:hypothetical protein